MTVGFAIINYGVVQDYIGSIHRADCQAWGRDAKNHCGDVEHFSGTLEEALAHYLDAEVRELGYSEDDVHVHNCCRFAK